MKKILPLLTCLLFATSLFGQVPPGYYDAASGLSGDPLKAALNNIIKGHVEFPYSSSSTDVWDILKETDRDPNNANNVVGLYSGFSMNAAAEYNSGNGWNREHVWAKSRGDFGTSKGAGTDVHHLRAADISTNSARSNRTFADAASDPYTDASGQYNGPTGSFTSSSEFIWKPRAEVRGDVARMIFYMATRYEGEAGEPDLELTDLILSNTDKSPLHGRLTDLLAWHQQDPVDNAERARNDIIYSYQNNRNPFIDHPEYVALIWGGATSNPPYFTSSGTTEGTVGEVYTYSISTGGGAGAVSITAPTKPSWLVLTDNGDGTATLTGTPTSSGTYSVQLQVTDGADSDIQNFDITVSSASASASELIFSEYIEGSSYNKAVEVANFTGSAVNLSSYQIRKQTNGSGGWSSGLTLSGSLSSGDVYVIAHSLASGAITSQANYTGTNSELNFNGNDALGLFKDGVLIDAIGTFNDGTNFAKDVTLVRNEDITSPNTTYSTSEWTSYPSNTTDYLGSHTMNGGGGVSNQAPSVSISSPSNGATFTDGETVNISASASDSDGTIVSVQFFVNGNSIGSDNTAPYTTSFVIGVGNYSISATATDEDGASTSSSSISIIGEEATPSSTLISFDDFESGWGTFRDGGADAYRYTGGTYAYGGSDAGGIQDNSGANSSFYTNNGFDVTGYDELEVEFFFYPRSMENGEDFWLRFYDGSSWYTVETWARGTDFSNNNFYVTTVYIDASQYNFSSNAKLRFQCDASGNADDVYIDEVSVTGIVYGAGSRRAPRETITEYVKAGLDEAPELDIDFTVYPNPTHDIISIQLISEEQELIEVSIIDINGKILKKKTIESVLGENDITIDLFNYDPGLYMVKVSQGEETNTQMVKLR